MSQWAYDVGKRKNSFHTLEKHSGSFQKMLSNCSSVEENQSLKSIKDAHFGQFYVM